MKKWLLIFFAGLLPGVSFAQDTYFQLWSDLNIFARLNDRWRLGGDAGYRLTPAGSRQTAYIRPAVRYRPRGWLVVTAGAANFNSWQPGSYQQMELRLFAYVHFYWPQPAWLRVSHRLGFDQRWFFLRWAEYNHFALRFRYQLGLRSPEFRLFAEGLSFYGLLKVEFLRDLNDHTNTLFFDHDRFIFGLGNKTGEHWRFEAQFMFVFLNTPSLKNFVREIDVLRLRGYYSF